MGRPPPSSAAPLAALFLGLLCWPLGADADLMDSLERRIGDMAARALEHETGLWPGPDTAALLEAITRDLFALRSRNLPYTLRTVDNHQINALALPGGHLYIFRGLVAHANSVDEIAAVVAHEMGHLEDRDFQRTVGRQLLWWALAGLLRREDQDDAAGVALVAGLLSSLRHSRRQEDQADGEAVRLTFLAGYDPSGLLTFFSRMRRNEGSWAENLFLTHPEPERREERARERMAGWLRGQPTAALRLCLALEARGRPALACQVAQGCREWPSHRRWAEAEAARLQAAAAEVAMLSLEAPRAGASPSELAAALEDLRRDRTIQQALEFAQAVDPETGELRYGAALACTVRALLRLRAMTDAGLEAVYRLGLGAELPAPVAGQLGETVGRVRRARQAGWALAAVLAELVASGSGEPLGRLTSARLAGVLGQVRWAEARVNAARESVADLLAACTLDLARHTHAALGGACRAQPRARDLLRFFAWGRPGEQDTADGGGQGADAGSGLAAAATGPADVDSMLLRWSAHLREGPDEADNGKRVEDLYLVAGVAYRQALGEIALARQVAGMGSR